jgi:predicted neutral ceramidase superfamily lipid hydrolase
VADNREEDRYREKLKLYFEFFKHFTTLAATIAVVLFALTATLGLATRPALVGVVAMGVTLLLSLLGLFSVMWKTEIENRVKYGIGLFWLMLLVMCVFFVGLFLLTVGIVDPENNCSRKFTNRGVVLQSYLKRS